MSSQATDTTTKVIPINPDTHEHKFEVDLGFTIVLELEHHDFDQFEIIFEKSWPANEQQPLTGSSTSPISFSMPHNGGTYNGHIVFKKHGTPKGKPVPFKAISCQGCG